MKVDKDDLFIGGIIIGTILCSPFILSYYAGKWIYKYTPWEQKKKKALDKEIHLLEEKLGLYGRDDKASHYDSHYYGNSFWDREDYREDLKTKLEKGYVSPPIIVVTLDIDPLHSLIPPGRICRIILLAHKDYFHIPEDLERADAYFRHFKSKVYKKGQLSRTKYIHAETRAECGNYEDYYIVDVPGYYEYNKIQSSSVIKGFIKDFKKKYSKQNKCLIKGE